MASIPDTEGHLRFSILKYITDAMESCTDEDQKESLQVASQCLTEGFGIDIEDEEQQRKYAVPLPLPQLFQVGLVAVARNQREADSAQSTMQAANNAGESDPLEGNAKYKQFIATLDKKGFFKNLTKGSPEEAARWQKARDTFVSKYGMPTTTEVEETPAATAVATEAPAEELSPEEQAARWEEADKAKARGNELLKKKQYEEAVAAYTEALGLRPDYPIYLCNRAAALTNLNRHEQALTDSERAISVDPGYWKAYSRLGFTYYQLGNYQESVNAYQRGLALDPNNTTMKQGMDNAQAKLTSVAAGPPDLSSMMTDPNVQNLMGSLGSNPNVAAMMQNPAMQQMAQQMMSDPAAMQSMMGMMSGLVGGEGAPDPSAMAGLMNNPQLAQMCVLPAFHAEDKKALGY